MDMVTQKALKEARGVTVHCGSLRLQFKLPDRPSPIRKSLGYPPTVDNIKTAINTLANVKVDIANRLYENDPDKFWEKHFPLNSINFSSSITVENCFAEFKKDNVNSLSDSMNDKINTALNWLKHFNFAKRDISSLTTENLNVIRNQTVAGNKKGKFQGCKTSTVKEYTNSLKKVFIYAEDKGYIKSNPVIGVRALPKDDHNWDNQDDDVRPFSQQELKLLLDVIHVPRLNKMVKFLAWTGLRHGELKALSWQDVHLDKGYIYVKYNLTRKGNLKNVKTRASVRKVELLPAALEVLKELKATSGLLSSRDEVIHFKNQRTKVVNRSRVFLSRGDEPYLRPELTTAPKQWEKWLRAANIPYRPAYQLRHTYASQLLTHGAEPTWLAKQMGHSDINMIGRIYGKWISDDNPDYIKKMAKKLGQSYNQD